MFDEDKILVSGASQEYIYRNMCCANAKKVAHVCTTIMNALQKLKDMCHSTKELDNALSSIEKVVMLFL